MSASGQLHCPACLKNYRADDTAPRLDRKLPWLREHQIGLTDYFCECPFCHVVWIQKSSRFLGDKAKLIGLHSQDEDVLLPLPPNTKSIPPKPRKRRSDKR
jgi:hypothetical protein